MRLQKFISETLTQIIHGVEDAQNNIDSDSGRINPRIIGGSVIENGREQLASESVETTPVSFDIAVLVDKGKTKDEGIGIVVASIGLGSRKKVEISDSSISRIKFEVPVLLPQKTKKL